MIGESALRAIELSIWPQGDATPGTLWAILDCARDRRIHRLLAVSRLDHPCLYSGQVPAELKAVAPHIVELHPGHRFTRTLLEEGWGRSWGIFARINDSTQLRHHLRKNLTVRSEDGRKLLFRFFDPRVFRVYLPTCTAAELAQLFGPVSKFFSEGPRGVDLSTYSFDGLRLSTDVVHVGKEAA